MIGTDLSSVKGRVGWSRDDVLFLGDEKMTSFGVDSLAAVSITASLKSEFSVNIPPTMFFDQNLSVEKMLQVIEEAKNSNNNVKPAAILSSKELFEQNLEKFFENSKDLTKADSSDSVFLTGATGFLGLHMLSGNHVTFSDRQK